MNRNHAPLDCTLSILEESYALYLFDSSTILSPLVAVCIIHPVRAVLDIVVVPIVPDLAVIAPACVIVTVGAPVGHAVNAVVPDDSIVVFPPLTAERLVAPIVHHPIVPVSKVQDFPVIVRVEILFAVIVFTAISFAVIVFEAILSAVINVSLHCPPNT